MTRDTSEKETKRRKIDISEAPDSEWPEAWVMSDDVEDQKAENRLEPNVPATVTDLRKLGIRCVIVQFVEMYILFRFILLHPVLYISQLLENGR